MTTIRLGFKAWRVRHGYRQEDVAQKMGMSRITVQSIELGKRDGRQSFWERFQETFQVEDKDMWELMKKG
ncbi:MAG: helix-turn-helix transcriptional regulator [Methanobrevibacter sp.]|nr:helix-turn-helix transcriptional regulator [Methanobrevibacter sp.]